MRIEGVNLTPAEFARRAGLSKFALYRAIETADCRASTAEKIFVALEQEELRLRDRLLTLHPLPAVENTASNSRVAAA